MPRAYRGPRKALIGGRPPDESLEWSQRVTPILSLFEHESGIDRPPVGPVTETRCTRILPILGGRLVELNSEREGNSRPFTEFALLKLPALGSLFSRKGGPDGFDWQPHCGGLFQTTIAA